MSTVLLLICLVVLAVAVRFYLGYLAPYFSNVKQLENIPGTAQLLFPVFHDSPKWLKNIVSTFTQYVSFPTLIGEGINLHAEKYGPVSKIILGPLKIVLIADPEIGKMVAVKGSKVFTKKGAPFSEFLEREIGSNILSTSDDNQWRRFRGIMNPAFSDNALQCVCGATNDALVRFKKEVSTNDIRDILEDAGCITLDVLGKAVFGYEFNAFANNGKPESMSRKTGAILGNFQYVLAAPKWMKYLPFGKYHELKKAIESVSEVVHDIIQNRKREITSGTLKSEHAKDLLQILIQSTGDAGDEQFSALNTKELVSNLIVLMIAGHETTARTLVFSLYALATNVEAQRKAQKFVDKVLGNKVPEYEDYEALKHIENIIKEAMRLYPVVKATPRLIREDFELKGFTIPKGAVVFPAFSIYEKDPNTFSKPYDFIPERWEDPLLIEKLTKNPYLYTPFGVGNRSCIGKRFSMIESVFTIADIMRNYNVTLADPNYGKMELETRITSAPKKRLFLRFEKRFN